MLLYYAMHAQIFVTRAPWNANNMRPWNIAGIVLTNVIGVQKLAEIL
jgi:hypothetical protein